MSVGISHSLRVPLQNQQVLEFRGAAAAVKSIVGRRLPWATLHLDNHGVLHGMLSGKVGTGMREQRRSCLRWPVATHKCICSMYLVCTWHGHAGKLLVPGVNLFFWGQGHGDDGVGF